ncbi:hypothetical protein A4G18_07380 [Pasteurellaceae bacterium Pebbles2]|nr:hypothetical protein [Pasteurellaceae bacterium Pebbles2]
MEIDRVLQNKVLHCLKEQYSLFVTPKLIYFACIENQPIPADDFDVQMLALRDSVDLTVMKHLRDNLAYLAEHNLIEPKSDSYKITAKGIDFITNDGGLSQILNVTTVRLSPDTLELLVNAINQSSLNPTDKQKLLAQLKELPVESIKQILIGSMVSFAVPVLLAQVL